MSASALVIQNLASNLSYGYFLMCYLTQILYIDVLTFNLLSVFQKLSFNLSLKVIVN